MQIDNLSNNYVLYNIRSSNSNTLATKIHETSKMRSTLQYLTSETNFSRLASTFSIINSCKHPRSVNTQKKRTIEDYARTIELFRKFWRNINISMSSSRGGAGKRLVDEIFAKVEDVITESNIRSFQTAVRWQKVKFAWEDRTVTGSLRAPTYSHVLFLPLFRHFFAYAFCIHGEGEHAYELLLPFFFFVFFFFFRGASQMYSRKLRVQIDFPYINLASTVARRFLL